MEPRFRAPEEAGPGPEVERRVPDAPTKLPKRSWGEVFKGTLKEFKGDELAVRAAALTQYGVLSLFPALPALVSLLGIDGKSATDKADRQRPASDDQARDLRFMSFHRFDQHK
ncbi:hypothetical protein [Streptomyces sp. NPDC001037]|uniref:hypothetical protein n=1 Tax=Streptomyces sp. NPDC001037 TaxID=3364542 RepID=UPI003678D798